MSEQVTGKMLSAYLTRIGLDGAPRADLAGLTSLQRAHRLSIPFENLDIMLGRPIRIDGASAFDKLVTAQRGGYCFEQNRLFGDMMAALGFSSRPLLGRVRLMVAEGATPGRTHTLRLVDLDGEQLIADAGFGGSFVPPMRLADGEECSTADGARHRLRRLGEGGRLDGTWLLERAGVAAAGMPPAAGDEWQPQYSFDLDEVAPEDLEMGNHWTSTREGTLFTFVHFVTIIRPTGFASLMDKRLTISENAQARVSEIEDAATYARTVRDLFRLKMSDEQALQLPLFAAR